MNKNQKHAPEANRLIRCKGHDWSPFECVLKWVPYKSPPNKKGSGRFMMQDRFGHWIAARETWKDVESWEYVDEQEPAQPRSSEDDNA